MMGKKYSKIAVVITSIVLLVVIIACWPNYAAERGVTKIGYGEVLGRNNWLGTYRSLNGTMERKLQVEGESLDIAVETISGDLAISVLDSEGTVVFSQEHMATGSVSVPISGEVLVRITAGRHQGSFKISGAASTGN